MSADLSTKGSRHENLADGDHARRMSGRNLDPLSEILRERR